MSKKRKKRSPILPNGAFIPRKIKDRDALGDNVFTMQQQPNGTVVLEPKPVEVLEEGTVVNKELLQPYEDFLGKLKNESGYLQDNRGVVASQEETSTEINESIDIAKEDLKYNMNEKHSIAMTAISAANTRITNEVKALNNHIDDEITGVNNTITTEVNRLDGLIDDTNSDLTTTNNNVTSVDQRLRNLEYGTGQVSILQIEASDFLLPGSNYMEPAWEISRNPMPHRINLVDNQVRAFVSEEQLARTSFNTTITINEPRTQDIRLYMGVNTKNQEYISNIVIPQGHEPFMYTHHTEFIDSDTFNISIRSTEDVQIAHITSLASLEYVGELNTSNVSLINPELESDNAGIADQFGLNMRNNQRLTEVEGVANNADIFRSTTSQENAIFSQATDWATLRKRLNGFFENNAQLAYPLTPNNNTVTNRMSSNSASHMANAIRTGLGITQTSSSIVHNEVSSKLQTLTQAEQRVTALENTRAIRGGDENFNTLNAGTTTLGVTTINGTTTLNGQLNVSGNLSARNFRGGLNWAHHVNGIGTGTHHFNAPNNLSNVYVTLTDMGQGVQDVVMAHIPTAVNTTATSNRTLEMRRSRTNTSAFNRHRLRLDTRYNRGNGLITITIQNTSQRFNQTSWTQANNYDGRGLQLTIIGY